MCLFRTILKRVQERLKTLTLIKQKKLSELPACRTTAETHQRGQLAPGSVAQAERYDVYPTPVEPASDASPILAMLAAHRGRPPKHEAMVASPVASALDYHRGWWRHHLDCGRGHRRERTAECAAP